MQNTTITMLSFLLVVNVTSALAQDWHWVRDDLIINPSGVQSFGSARIDLGDVDGDSWLDLVVLDSLGMRLYRNRGVSTSIAFERRPDWEFDPQLHPSNREIPTLADLNGDGRADLILPDRVTNSLRYWQNTGNTAGSFWTRADSVLRAFVGREFVEFVDFDHDDDPDAVTKVGTELNWYRNIGSSANPIWRPDSLDLFNPGFGGAPLVNIRFADYDKDGWSDAFISRDWGWNEALVQVGRNVGDADSLQFEFPQYSSALRESWHTTIAVGDVDKDGKIDLLTGHATPALFLWNSDFDTLRSAFYQIGNLGFPFGYLETGLAIYDLKQDGSGEMILVHPELPTDIPSAYLIFTKFKRQNSLWLRDPDFSIFLEDHVLSNPTLNRVDWDGDGVPDFILGADKVRARMVQSVLVYFTNHEPQPHFFSDFLPDSLYHDPALVDINDDAMLDLLLERSGRYLFYENTGTLAEPNWEARPEWSEDLATEYHYRAETGDLTEDGLLDVVFGERDGSLKFFRNVGTRVSPKWQADDAAFANVRADSFAIPTLVDLDQDTDLDLILGDRLGRFRAFRNEVVTAVSDEAGEVVNPRGFSLFPNYPNPFNPATAIAFSLPRESHVRLNIYNLLGRQVAALVDERIGAGTHRIEFSATGLPSGVYVYRIRTEEFQATRKLLLLK